ncbi:probable S-adenosylmethionine-dependent methyltransferase Crg1p [Monosporozyma servazzii]
MPSTSYLDKNFKSSYYDKFRPSYPETLADKVISYHKKTPGNVCNVLLDVGCGTGIATSLFAPKFKKCIAADPSSSMLDCARKTIPKDANVVYKEVAGEKLIEDGNVDLNSVDLVIGAESVHWCDLDILFEQVNKILKPNGTFAFWFYTQPEFIDLPGFNELYYKYGWSDEFMGSYLTPYQREFFTKFNENEDLMNKLKKQFTDIEFEISCHSQGHSDPNAPYYQATEMSMTDLRHLVRTWSLYTSWIKNHPDDTKDIADRFVDEVVEKFNITDESKMFEVQWTTFYYICRKN